MRDMVYGIQDSVGLVLVRFTLFVMGFGWLHFCPLHSIWPHLSLFDLI